MWHRRRTDNNRRKVFVFYAKSVLVGAKMVIQRRRQYFRRKKTVICSTGEVLITIDEKSSCSTPSQCYSAPRWSFRGEDNILEEKRLWHRRGTGNNRRKVFVFYANSVLVGAKMVIQRWRQYFRSKGLWFCGTREELIRTSLARQLGVGKRQNGHTVAINSAWPVSKK